MITPDELMERALEDMSAYVCVEPGIFATLLREQCGLGACGIKGTNPLYLFRCDCLASSRDRYLLPPPPSTEANRATRMKFCFRVPDQKWNFN